MLDEHELNAVLKVAEMGSFSLAAKKLFVSQPSLSQCVKKLETELGVQLFDRTSNPLELTPEGQVYAKCAQQVCELKKDMLRQIADLSELKTGTLNIGSSYTRSMCLLRDVLPLFCQRFTGIKVHVCEASNYSLVERLQNGELDFALLYEPLDKKIFSTIPLMDEKVLLAVPRNHRLAKGIPLKQSEPYPKISFKELADENFIVLKKTRKMREIYDILCSETETNPNAIYEANSIIGSAELCAKGMGMTLVTDTLRYYSTPEETPVMYELAEWKETRKLVIAKKKDRVTSKAAEVFINTILKHKLNL